MEPREIEVENIRKGDRIRVIACEYYSDITKTREGVADHQEEYGVWRSPRGEKFIFTSKDSVLLIDRPSQPLPTKVHSAISEVQTVYGDEYEFGYLTPVHEGDDLDWLLVTNDGDAQWRRGADIESFTVESSTSQETVEPNVSQELVNDPLPITLNSIISNITVDSGKYYDVGYLLPLNDFTAMWSLRNNDSKTMDNYYSSDLKSWRVVHYA